jgi:nucleotide-binding universal stress UspA family protein
MHALIWIVENTWQACVDEARAIVAADAKLTLLHVTAQDAEALVGDSRAGLLGRRAPPPAPALRQASTEQAQALLADAGARLRRPSHLQARRGRIEREVIDACADADLLVLARDGEPRPGPKSLGPRTRFVVDHAPCPVLLVWPDRPRAVAARASRGARRHAVRPRPH